MNNDLISRSVLLEEFEWLKENTGAYNHAAIDEIILRIKNVPAVDAVEVVRCMDCKRHYDSRFGYVVCALFNRAVRVDGYCSYGCKIDAEVE